MAKARKVEQLQPEDFPGVERIAFARWRAAAVKYEPIAWTVYIVIALLLAALFLGLRPLRGVTPFLRIPLFAAVTFGALLGSILLLTREPRRLAKVAGITPEAIKEARRRPRPATVSAANVAVAEAPPAMTPDVNPPDVLTQAPSPSTPPAPPPTPPAPPPLASGSPYGNRPGN